MNIVEKERLCRHELDEFRDLIGLDASGFPADVEAALRFLHDHLFEESLNASRVQEQDGLRSHNLPARFKRYLGLGLRDYIEDRRIMAAMRLLWHRDLEVYFIAAAVGYAHHETFTRAFKRRVGCTPTQFRAHFPPGAPEAPDDEPLSPSIPDAPPPTQSAEATMFITDVIGIQTGSGNPDLRVEGSAAGQATVLVTVTGDNDARSEIADVRADGTWIARFPSNGALVACGETLQIEAGQPGDDEGRVRWEGPLECADLVPPRRASAEETNEDAVPTTRQARGHDGGGEAEDAVMTVMVASGAEGTPAVNVHSAAPTAYAEEPTHRNEPSRRKRTAEREERPHPSRRATADDDVEDLRAEVERLREQFLALRQDDSKKVVHRQETTRPDEDQRDDAVPHDRATTRENQDTDEQSSVLRELREEIRALRTERADPEHTPPPQPDADRPDDEEPAARDRQTERRERDDNTFDLRNAVRSLQDQIEALREHGPGPSSTDSSAEAETNESEPEEPEAEHADDRAEQNRADLYEAVQLLRQRVVDLERQDDQDAERRDPPREKKRSRTERARDTARELQNRAEQVVEDDHDEAPPRRRRPGERDDELGNKRRRNNKSPGRAEAPVIRFEPVEVGDWTDEGRCEIHIRARVSHPSGEPVAAELVDDRTGDVLADGRSERGRLTLSERVEVEPGRHTFTVHVNEPSPARLALVWELDEERARAQGTQGEVDGEEEDDSAGWISRAVGAGWALVAAAFLLSLASGVHGLLRGIVTAVFLGSFGTYLALTIPRRWAIWTFTGVGLFALSLVAFLPFTPIVQMDSYLLVAGLAALGLLGAGGVALFKGED